MNRSLLTVICPYLVLVVLLALLAAWSGRCAVAARTGVIVAELLLLLQVLLDVTSLLRGHRPREMATHLGYAAVSVALFPVLTARADSPPSRMDHMVIVVAAATAIVVTVRLYVTWEP